ncbi:MAG TPA: FecR domain-containing protein [Vicinamibacteria bacterium]|nr:FecR domain-containing protein [Vicinamibacteria bacterium]
MTSDEKQPPQQGGDRIEWFTVSYRTLALAGVAVVLLAVLAFVLFGPKAAPPPPPATVETGARFLSIEGSVQVKRAGTLEWVPATRALVLRPSDLVRTGSGGAAEILLADGMHVSVRPDSLITIVESSQNPVSREQRTALAIQSGEANFQTAARGVPGSTTLSTPTVRATAERDTTGNIRVAEGGATGLRIFRGQGQAETRGGQRIAVKANQGVNVDAAGAAGPTVSLPTVPLLTAPPNQTEIVYRNLADGLTLLMWNGVSGASGYRVMVDFGPSFSRPLYDRRVGRSTQMELRALEAGSYYWKVAAIGGEGAEGAFSDLWRFSLAKAPPVAAAAPSLLFDAAELKGNVLHVRGRTEPGASLSLDGQRLEVQADGSFNEFVAFEGTAGATVVLKATGVGGGSVEQRRRVSVAN